MLTGGRSFSSNSGARLLVPAAVVGVSVVCKDRDFNSCKSCFKLASSRTCGVTPVAVAKIGAIVVAVFVYESRSTDER